jgi:hypothetical protein
MDNCNIYLEEIAWEDMDWIDLAQDGTVGALFEQERESPGNIRCGYLYSSRWCNSRRISVLQDTHNLRPSLLITFRVRSRWMVWEGDEVFDVGMQKVMVRVG